MHGALPLLDVCDTRAPELGARLADVLRETAAPPTPVAVVSPVAGVTRRIRSSVSFDGLRARAARRSSISTLVHAKARSATVEAAAASSAHVPTASPLRAAPHTSAATHTASQAGPASTPCRDAAPAEKSAPSATAAAPGGRARRSSSISRVPAAMRRALGPAEAPATAEPEAGPDRGRREDKGSVTVRLVRRVASFGRGPLRNKSV